MSHRVVLRTVHLYTIYRRPLSVQACIGNYAIINYSDLKDSESLEWPYAETIKFKTSYCLYVALLLQGRIYFGL